MSSEQFRTTTGHESDSEADDTRATVQLLVSDTGNRTAIRKMLDNHFAVETSETVQGADLYLIEDHLFSEYHERLREQVERAHPVFCPVVLIRRQTTELAHPSKDAAFQDGPVLVDDVVDAPVDQSLLIRRLHSLLVRRRQSQELSSNVSALERREQELRRFERGVESTGNGIVMTNRLGEIDYVNPAFEEVTGYAESEVLGETPRVLQPAGAVDVFTEQFWQTMTDQTEWAGEIVIDHSDETRLVVDTSITAIQDDDGHVEGFVVVMVDITERIQQEEELQRREEELERLRQILTRYLRHNLRNDLNVILGYGEALASDETLSDGHRQEAEKIVEMAQRLQEKSDTARRYSTLLQQDTELSSHDLSVIVNESARTISDQYPDVEFTVDVPEACDVRAQTGIRDAIEELIENAAEHADSVSPRVTIRLRDSNGARLVIEDNGSGISDLELEALEEGEETPLSHSQGIGLWLSKWQIESFDGKLSFEHLDPGTRVIVDCPPPDRTVSMDLDISTLKEREQRLQTATERMTDAIVEVNASWEITFIDPKAEEILDVSAEEVQGEDMWNVFSDLRGTELEAVHREVMETRFAQHVETYYAGIDGWVSVQVYPEFDGGISLYFRDTTERNRHKQELQRAQTRIELALGVTDSTVWEWDVGTDSVTTHPDVHTVFGAEITTGDEFIAAVHPEDQSQVRDALETAIGTETPYSAEYRVQCDDGIRWVEDYGELRRDEEDGSKRLLGIARDISDLKERERQLYRHRTLLGRTEEVAGTGGWEADVTTGEQRWTEGTYQIHDLSPDTEFNPTVQNGIEFYHPDDRAEIRDAVTRCIEHGEPYELEVRLISATDQRKWIRTNGEPVREDGDIVAIRGAIVDITDLKEREQELEQARERFLEAEALGDLGAWEFDRDGTIVWTDGTRRIHEVDEDLDPTMEDALDFFHPDDRADIEQAVNAAVEDGESYERVLRLITAEGNQRWVRTRGKVLEDEEPRTVRGYIQDITDRKERERELERAHELLEHTERIADVGSWEIDTDTMDVSWSENLFEIVGVDADDEPQLEEALDVYHEDDRQIVESAIENALETGEPFDVEARFQPQGDAVHWLRVQGRPTIADGNIVTLRGAVQDITEYKTLEAEHQRDGNPVE